MNGIPALVELQHEHRWPFPEGWIILHDDRIRKSPEDGTHGDTILGHFVVAMFGDSHVTCGNKSANCFDRFDLASPFAATDRVMVRPTSKSCRVSRADSVHRFGVGKEVRQPHGESW